jgi:hypothetical protein
VLAHLSFLTFDPARCCNGMEGVWDLWRHACVVQVVRDHWLGLSCIWDWTGAQSSNGTVPAPFTTWKFRPDGVSQRTIDFIWCVSACMATLQLR